MRLHTILGVHIARRTINAPNVQKILSEYGCNIKTRIGLHDVATDYCATSGLLLLELVGDLAECRQLEKKLKALKGLEVKRMSFKDV